MGMQIGAVLVAESGFDMLRAGAEYHFLRSNRLTKVVLLVQFIIKTPVKSSAGKKPPSGHSIRPVLIKVRRDRFEHGMSTGAIAKISDSPAMPRWIGSLAGKNLAQADSERKKQKRSHMGIIDERFRHIQPLLDREDDILNASNPDKEINQHARQCSPVQHETRLRLWFYTYLLFGRNKMALHYATESIGTWLRTEGERKKQGTPSKYFGSSHGYHADASMRAKMVEGYKAYARSGMSMVTVFGLVMTKVFHCTVARDEHGLAFYIQPEGEPIPTENMFRYHVKKAIGPTLVRKTKIGVNRERSENQPSMGKFTAGTANLMESIETDGNFLPELPRGFVDGSPLPALCQVIDVDVASGMIVGIGFSQGSETAEAYRQAKFCAAIDKVVFCRLAGITIRPEQWPSKGLSPHWVRDRGPGSGDKAQPASSIPGPVYRGLSVAGSGQSKAIVETSHPKTVSNTDAPSFVTSNLTPYELCVRAIHRVLIHNDTKNIQGHVPVELIPHVRKPSPTGLWNALDNLGRNDAQNISFADAVRNFLTIYPATICADGVHFNGQVYDSSELRESMVLDRVALQHASISIKIYALFASGRYIWLDLKEGMIELEMTSPMRVADDTLYLTLSQMDELNRIRKENEARFERHVSAARSEAEEEYFQQTGKKWNSSTRKPGRPKRGTKAATQEAIEAKNIIAGKHKG